MRFIMKKCKSIFIKCSQYFGVSWPPGNVTGQGAIDMVSMEFIQTTMPTLLINRMSDDSMKKLRSQGIIKYDTDLLCTTRPTPA